MAGEVVHQLKHRKPRIGQRPPPAIAHIPFRRFPSLRVSVEGSPSNYLKRRMLPNPGIFGQPPARGRGKRAAVPAAAPSPINSLEHRHTRAVTNPPPAGKPRRRKIPTTAPSLPRSRRILAAPFVPIRTKAKRRRLAKTDGVLRERRRTVPSLPPIYARHPRRPAWYPQHGEPTPNKRLARPRGVLPPQMGSRARRRVPGTGLVGGIMPPQRRSYRAMAFPAFAGRFRRGPAVPMRPTTLPPSGKWARVGRRAPNAAQHAKRSDRRRVPLLTLVAAERVQFRKTLPLFVLSGAGRRYTRLSVQLAGRPILKARQYRPTESPLPRFRSFARRVPLGPYQILGPYKSVAGQIWTPGDAPGMVIQE